MSIARLSIKRPVFVASIVFLLLMMGAFSLTKLGVDQFPNITFPVVSIQTVYAGASPNDIETLVSKPIEDELGSLAGLKRLSSNNLESVSIVVVEFNLGTDIKYAEQQIRNRLGNIRRNLPAEIEEPLVRQIDPSDQPILRIGVSSKLKPAELYDVIHDQVKTGVERINGVGLVDIVGGRKREIKVYVDRKRLQEYEIPMTQISQRMQSSSKNVPVGKAEGGSTETVFRSVGEFASIDSIKSVAINFLGSDRPVKLSDVARVEDGLEEEKTRSYLNGEPAVFLDVFKQSGSNTVQVAKDVKRTLTKLNDDLKKRGFDVNLTLVRDGSHAIKINIDDVNESILIGIVLCVVVVFFFLGSFKSTVITGLSLPNSLLGAFILMYAMGFTINIMTLLALSLAVGLLIDDAIVVRENIFRHMEMGKNPRVAAEEGTNEVSLAVIATTLVVMAVFGPIAFLGGIVGQFFREFGLTIVFAVAISLFDAMTVAPMLSAYWTKAGGGHGQGGRGPIAFLLRGFENFQSWLERLYVKALRFTVRHPKTILAAGVVIFIASLALVKGIPKTFLPPADIGEFQVFMEMPPGTTLDAMGKVTMDIDQKLRTNPVIRVTAPAVGTQQGESNKGSVYVSLKESKGRRGITTSMVKEEFRKRFAAEYAGHPVVIRIQDYDAFGGGQRPFNFFIKGENLDEVSAYSQKVMAKMKEIPGFVDVDSNYRAGKPEFQVVFEREKAESLGVLMGVAGMELRSRVEGVVPATYRANGQEYDVRIQMDDAYRDLRREFTNIVVPNINQNMIPLRSIATGKETSGFSQINRQNKARFVNISGDIGAGGALDQIMTRTREIVEKEIPAPPGVTWEFVGQAENFQELMQNMVIAVFFGIAFIYLVLASLYDSFVTPFTILLALPLAVCGAFAALFITGASINIFSMIGMIMLLGVVTKNSILLVDYTIQLTEEGMPRTEALVEACKTRLRPILMTSIALIAGMIPIAIGLNEASKQRTAMGIGIIGGLISSTALTLLIVPAAYGYVDDFRRWCLKIATGSPDGVKD